jgi:hypothetical protein
VNGKYCYSFGAIALHFFVMQAGLRLCARILARFYLALHPAGSLPVGYAVTVVVGCPVKNEENGCTGTSPAQLCAHVRVIL